MPQPKNVKQLRSFLDLYNYNRNIIKNYTFHCTPLINLLSKECVWTSEAYQSFEDLKTLLTQTPMLHYPDLTKSLKYRCKCRWNRRSFESRWQKRWWKSSAICFSNVATSRAETKKFEKFCHKLQRHFIEK